MRKKILMFVGLIIISTSCKMGPNYSRPTTMTVTNDFRTQDGAGESIVNLPWFELFGDSVLQGLVTEALANNRDLRSSMARIDEASANLGIVRSDLFPNVSYGVVGGVGTTGSSKNQDLVASLPVSYQVDLWGRISRSNEAALQELLGTEEAYRAITIALIAEVANSYLLLRDIDNRLLVAENTAEAWRRSLQVIRARFNAGIVSEVDVNQSEIQLADAEAFVKNFERIRGQTENAISLLLSKPPMSIERGLKLSEQIFPPEVPIGLPSELLDRRPDILEIERLLHAQTARIGVAEALKYPQLTLGADLGAVVTGSPAAFAGLGADLLGPLFNAGKNKRRVEVEIARTEQLLNQYEQTFYTALRDVEDAMIAVNTYKEEYDIRRNQVLSAQNAADLSWTRYEAGMTSYLEVLDVQRSLFTSQLISSETLQLHLSSVVRLYKELGGGWIPPQDSTGVVQNQP